MSEKEFVNGESIRGPDLGRNGNGEKGLELLRFYSVEPARRIIFLSGQLNLILGVG
jgi:hypothetical protein